MGGLRFLKYFFLLLLVLQLPFAYRLCKTRNLDRYLEELALQEPGRSPFQDLRGSLHIHSAAGSHSLGTYPEIIDAAKAADYDYLWITDHPKEYRLFHEIQDPQLVVLYGTEEEASDGRRYLVLPDSDLKILSRFESDVVPLDATGLEIFNIAESAESSNDILGWMTWLYHRAYGSDLFFFHAWQLNRERLRVWDRELEQRPIAAFAGNNAHRNVGILLLTGTGERLFSLFVDPYLDSLRFVTNHIQLSPGVEVNEETVVDALERGASYICFERIADPTGFSFHARVEGRVAPMGSSVPVGSELIFQSPFEVRFRVIRNGRDWKTLEGRRFVMTVERRGAYRLEVELLNPPSLVQGKPWILSNAIMVR